MLNKLKTWLGIKPPKSELNYFKFGFKAKRYKWGYSLKMGNLYQEDTTSFRTILNLSLFIETKNDVAKNFFLYNKQPSEVTLENAFDDVYKTQYVLGSKLMHFIGYLLREEVDGELVNKIEGTLTIETKEEERCDLTNVKSLISALINSESLKIKTSKREEVIYGFLLTTGSGRI